MATAGDTKSSLAGLFFDECVERHFPERQYTRDQILRELVASSVACDPDLLEILSFEWSQKDTTVDAICSDIGVWERVEKLIDSFARAITRTEPAKATFDRWSHQPLIKLDQKQEWDDSPDLEELTRACRDYRRSWWAVSPALEIWIARQMIFAETFAFGREAGIPPSKGMLTWVWGKSLVKWVIGVWVALTMGDKYGAAAGVLAYVLWLCMIRFLVNDYVKQQNKKSSAFMAMRNCYVIATRESPCPAELSNSLTRAENSMVVWPEELRSLVERQLQKRRDLWA